MWRRSDLHPGTAVGMITGMTLVILALVGVAPLAQRLWPMLALAVVLWMRRP